MCECAVRPCQDLANWDKNKTINTTAPGYPRWSKHAHSPTFISRNRSRKVPGGSTALMKNNLVIKFYEPSVRTDRS